MPDGSLPSDAAVTALGLDSGRAEPLLGGRVSQVWRCYRDGKPVAVRLSPAFRDLPQVSYECDLLGRISQGWSKVASPVAEPVVVDGHVWVAFEWAPGRHPSKPVPDPWNWGRLLGELHNASGSLASGVGQRPSWSRLDQFFDSLRADGETTLRTEIDAFADATGSRGRRLKYFAESVHERLADADLGRLPTVAVQGDFGPHQVLMQGDEVSAVLDWDFCHLDYRLADLGVSTSLARPSADRAGQFLGGYLSVADEDPGDLRLLTDFHRAFHLNGLGHVVCGLWAKGVDCEAALGKISERLEREQWWGATIAAAVFAPLPTRRADPSSPPTDDLGIAHGLADSAGLIAAHYFAIGVAVESKEDQSPVTDADLAVEYFLRERLAQLRPDDAVLGEELGSSGSSDRVWLLDPIDGTKAFAAGSPNWRVQVALEERGEVVLGVVASPALEHRWWATKGGGAYERDESDGSTRQLAVSTTSDISAAVIAVKPLTLAPDLHSAEPTNSGWPRPLTELLSGRSDAYYVECCGPWDHAPWIILVKEAGGSFTDHDGGQSAHRRGGLYSNRVLHTELTKLTVAKCRME